jgi:hypothetical protein
MQTDANPAVKALAVLMLDQRIRAAIEATGDRKAISQAVDALTANGIGAGVGFDSALAYRDGPRTPCGSCDAMLVGGVGHFEGCAAHVCGRDC